MSTTHHHRRALRRAESRLFEAIAAGDDGDLTLANQLLEHAVTPRRARATRVSDERAWLSRQRSR